ncbi:MAG: alpha/beta hydrolase [Clostridia bacterium]|nr:alpha/beta hydrolase [Clostridia bacterium]
MKDERNIKGTFSSSTGLRLDYRLWLPEGQPRAVIQLVHGMAEHIDRYDATARALADVGFAVVGHTHLGHGTQARIKGYFAEKDGWQHLIEDVHLLRQRTQQHLPGVPYVLLGHSMGSFVVRCYLMQYADDLSGAILSGTGFFPKPVALLGLGVAKLVCLFGGEKKPSKLINSIAFGSSNKLFKPARTDFDWLTRDEAIVDAYVADPYCGFIFTGSAYRDFFSGLNRLTKVEGVPADLPVLLFSGEKDPVGSGNGVQKVAEQLRKAGVKQVDVKLYPDARHEMFNELNRQEVWQDVAEWVNKLV